MDAIIAFYRGEGRDHCGRRIEEMWRFDRDTLERRHDFIQWLFPLAELSRFNSRAPLVTSQTSAAFRDDPELGRALLRSLDLMLDFYGLQRAGDRIEKGPDFPDRAANWFGAGNHNHLRLSRIVKSLALLGQPALARALRDRLLAIADDYGPTAVAPGTRRHWACLLLSPNAAPESASAREN